MELISKYFGGSALNQAANSLLQVWKLCLFSNLQHRDGTWKWVLQTKFCGEKLAMRIKGGLLAGREASALELYKLESGSPKSNWQLVRHRFKSIIIFRPSHAFARALCFLIIDIMLQISDIKRRTNTTGLGEEDMLCIMSGPIKDADGSSVM